MIDIRGAGTRHRKFAALIVAGTLALVIGHQVPMLSQIQVVLLISITCGAIATMVRQSILVVGLYNLVFISTVGLLSLAPLAHIGPINGHDVLFIVLLVLTTPAYFDQRRKLNSAWFRRLERAWAVIIILIAVQAVRSPASTASEALDNMHVVEGFVFFFPSVAVLSSKIRFAQMAIFGLLAALAGTALTLAQSLNGLSLITTSPFYDHSTFEGTKQMVGNIARVSLPVSDWVAFVLLSIAALSLLRFRWWYTLAAGVLMLTILVNFARSLWLGVVTALVLQVVGLVSVGQVNTTRAVRVLLVPFSIVSALIAAPYLGLQGVSDALLYRIDEGVFFFSSDQGTWATRQIDAADALRLFWETNPIWGVGTSNFKVVGFFIDLGYVATLVSIGFVGLAVVMYLLVTCCLAAVATLRAATARSGLVPSVLALGAISEVVLIVVYTQVAVDPRKFAILGLCTAMIAVSHRLYLSSETESAPETTTILNGPPARLGRSGMRLGTHRRGAAIRPTAYRRSG